MGAADSYIISDLLDGHGIAAVFRDIFFCQTDIGDPCGFSFCKEGAGHFDIQYGEEGRYHTVPLGGGAMKFPNQFVYGGSNIFLIDQKAVTVPVVHEAVHGIAVSAHGIQVKVNRIRRGQEMNPINKVGLTLRNLQIVFYVPVEVNDIPIGGPDILVWKIDPAAAIGHIDQLVFCSCILSAEAVQAAKGIAGSHFHIKWYIISS